jgi:hypothetical protein
MPPIKIANPFFIANRIPNHRSRFWQLSPKATPKPLPLPSPTPASTRWSSTPPRPVAAAPRPSIPRLPSHPVKQGEIKVTYDAKEPGRFTKTVTVYHNGENGMDVLEIRGTVVSEQLSVSSER